MAPVSRNYSPSAASESSVTNNGVGAVASATGALTLGGVAWSHASRIMDGPFVPMECASLSLDPAILEKLCGASGISDVVVLAGTGVATVVLAGLAAYLTVKASR